MEAQLEVVDLARTTAEAINKLANWGHYTAVHDHYESGDNLMSALAKTEGRLRTVARRRAEASGRLHDFEAVLEETRLEFFLQEAEIFKKEMPVDPRLEAMRAVEGVEEAAEAAVCGVCQEELVVGEKDVYETACMHKFHGFCLWRWLDDHKTCPLCRFKVLE